MSQLTFLPLFTDVMPRGPEELFGKADLDELLRTLDAVRATALAA